MLTSQLNLIAKKGYTIVRSKEDPVKYFFKKNDDTVYLTEEKIKNSTIFQIENILDYEFRLLNN